MKTYISLLALLTFINMKVCANEVTYPQSDMEICSNSPIIIKWSGALEVAKVKVKALNDSTFKDIINYEIHDNTFSWYANDSELLNVPLIFQVSDGENDESKALSPMITIYKKTEVKVINRSVRICEGENVVLDLETDGYNLSYQWYKDDEPIIGAKSKVLEIPNADYYSSGLYKCEVSCSSICEPVISEEISVYVVTKTRLMNKPEFY
ncbi:MAG: immunoglobulin domain-containing protein, partial [Candidatus Kapabacteria bacterium]|nr:immunoglobulin domain-containing protein [Candidatus Kapabacteria bacterium]